MLLALVAGAEWRFNGGKSWVQDRDPGQVEIVTTAATIIMFLLGIAATAGGLLIALFASHRAPDGFEDQDGFHVGRLPPATRDK